MPSISSFAQRARIAYFSMEIAVRNEMHTYSGGLGVLAGDTVRSAADMDLPAVFVTLMSRAGYFRQRFENGQQIEEPDWWEPEKWCEPLDAVVAIPIDGRSVWVRPWLYVQTSSAGHKVPILLLDTYLEQNTPADREITHQLYGDGEEYRMKQEIILGLGGIKLLRALGFHPEIYHMNEGHAAFLTLDLLSRAKVPDRLIRDDMPHYDLSEVRRRCVFTTHTPVEAGHDRFPYELAEKLLPQVVPIADLKRLAGADLLNMTQLALNLSGYVNGVARRHAETTSKLFPQYTVRAITNGVHAGRWASPAMTALFDSKVPYWRHEPELLVHALQFPEEEVWNAHRIAKADLVQAVRDATSVSLDPDLPIIGFARRMTGYKRPALIFSDPDRLAALAEKHPFQVVFAGKAHPRDTQGKENIARIHEIIGKLSGKVNCAFLPNYDMSVARFLVSGTDVWLNNPLPPMEASGTSGMKAGLNGVLNLSVLDGWWIEACIDGVNGWAIGSDGGDSTDDGHASALYELLEQKVLPLYHGDPEKWRWMMKQSIGTIAYYFNSARMMRRYVAEAYLT